MFPIRDHNPSERTPWVTRALIAVNCLVYLLQLPIAWDEMAMASFWFDWALIPAFVSEGEQTYTLLTSMFLHAGFAHLAGNMLFLWIFGDNLEDQMGHLPYLAFYLACGLLAEFAHIAADPASVVPTIGASGAIGGVMGGYLLLFPRARVDILLIFIIFFRVFAVPAWLMLGLWFVFQVAFGFGTPADLGGVAYWAHAGGFVAGAVLTLPVWLRRGAVGFWRRTEGVPPHPEAVYSPSLIPRAGRRRR